MRLKIDSKTIKNDSTMNMREYWANEAAMMRDKSGVLGKEVLMPVGSNAAPKNAHEDFRTGYWLEGNTIVFSTFVYDNTKRGIEAREKMGTSKSITDTYMLAAKSLQADLSEIEKDKAFVSNYSFDFRWKVVDAVKYEYKYSLADTELPPYYYMNLNDGSGGEGGTHPNSNNRTGSAYFSAGVPINLIKAGRTILHESLHPVLEHSMVKNNPIYPIFQSFFTTIKKMRDERDERKMPIAQRDREINSIIKANGVNLGDMATIIRENIMTTEAIRVISDNLQYHALTYYLFDYQLPEIEFKGFNNGTKIHPLQIESIVKQLK